MKKLTKLAEPTRPLHLSTQTLRDLVVAGGLRGKTGANCFPSVACG